MQFQTLVIGLVLSTVFLGAANAHGNHPKAGTNQDDDWATRHMQEEHHINSFDASSFFSMHDYDQSGSWDRSEVRRTYGLNDESNAHLTEEQIGQALQDVFAIFDQEHTGLISREEFTERWSHGMRLPDFGHGPGHHGDDEYEYEIHHFEKFHDENTKEEDLTHPEDIAHFKKHDQMEDEAERLEILEQMPIVEENIPGKFRTSS